MYCAGANPAIMCPAMVFIKATVKAMISKTWNFLYIGFDAILDTGQRKTFFNSYSFFSTS